MRKNQINPMPEYFDRYIALADDTNLLQALSACLDELKNLPFEKLHALGNQLYAPNKWTIKDIFQHIIDTERIFAYRALAFSRGEKMKMLTFDEDAYATEAYANARELQDIIKELILVRESSIAMYKSFSNAMLLKSGQGFTGEYSVLAIGFLIAGHQRWHWKVIEEKYFPLLEK